jgi:small conductance mechanosensitive channel
MKEARLILALLCSLSIEALAQGPRPVQPPQGSSTAEQPVEQTADSPQAEKLSEAERIARLQRAIDEGGKQIQDLQTQLNDPESEYLKAQAAFQDADSKREAARKDVEELRAQSDAEMVAAAEEDLKTIEKQWDLAKERFDLAIQERKVSQEQLASLEHKLRADLEAMTKLTQPADAAKAPEPAQPQPAATADTPATPQPAQQPPSGIALPTSGIPTPGEGATKSDAPPTKGEERQEVKEAEQEAAAKEEAAKEAEEEARSIEARIAKLNESIKSERSLLDLAQKQSDNAVKTGEALNEELQKRWANKATWTETQDLLDQIEEHERLEEKARAETKEHTSHLVSLQGQLNDLKDERIAALQEAERKRAEAEKAQKELAALQNPFTIDNLLAWLVSHGPKILGIVVGMFVLVLLARVLESRLVPLMARHGRGGHSVEDRENRAKTLMSVFHNTVRIVVIIGGILMLLAEVGLNIVPLVTAAGIAGLAIAFGAQNLIRDYFYGFTILLENQYMVNDVVRIAGISGMVERITLRITVLRDLEGIVHFVPHGEIKTVSNLTHGWSRSLFEIGIAYKEEPDKVMKVLTDLGKELRRDPEFSAFILDDPEMLGVDQLGDSSVIIKFLIKTRPLKQWVVKREMLRRIKRKFDDLGIEIPFPSRTIYHHYMSENGALRPARLRQERHRRMTHLPSSAWEGEVEGGAATMPRHARGAACSV